MELSEESFPRKIRYLAPSFDNSTPAEKAENTRTFKTSVSPIWNEESVLERILFVVEDLTEVEKLEKQVTQERESNSKNIQLIQELAELDKQSAENFFSNSSATIRECFALARNLKNSSDTIHTLFRNIHTLKGNSRAYKLSLIATVTHFVETDVDSVRELVKSGKPIDDEQIKKITSGIEQIRLQFREYSQFGKRIFGIEDEFQTALVGDLHKMLGDLDAALLIVVGELRYKINQATDENTKKQHLEKYKEFLLSNNSSEIQQLTHSLKVSARLSHTIKGVSRSHGDPALSDLVHRLENGLGLIREPKNLTLENISADLFIPLDEIKRNLAKVFLNSSLVKGFSTEREIWRPLFLEAFSLALLFKEYGPEHEVTMRTKVGRIAHSMGAHCGSNRMDFLMQILSQLEKKCEVASPLFLKLMVREIWKFLGWVSFLETSLKLNIEQRQEISRILSAKAPPSSQDVQSLKSMDSVFISSLLETALAPDKIKNLLDVLKDILVVNENEVIGKMVNLTKSSSFDLSGVEIILAKMENDNETVKGLEELGKDQNPIVDQLKQALTIQLFKISTTESCLPISTYYQKVDLLRVLRGFRGDSGSAGEEHAVKMMPVIEMNYNALMNSLDNSADVTTVKKAAKRLLELPASSAVSRFTPMVADIARTLNKKVSLQLVGLSVKLDREKLYTIQDALLHMIRNSVDHGIEKPDVRANLGKPEDAKIELKFANVNDDWVKITIVDDGKGIDADALARKALAKKFITEDQIQNMIQKEKLNLIFLPGLSTAEAVTQFSGRGVGMDVVKKAIEKLGGKVQIESQVGKGTTIALEIPR